MSRSSFVIVSLVLFLIGLLIIFNSVRWGSGSANAYLQSQGGGMDSAQFMIVFQESITTYRWMGIILSVVSGFGFVRAIELKERT